jgi:hypothetical protein
MAKSGSKIARNLIPILWISQAGLDRGYSQCTSTWPKIVMLARNLQHLLRIPKTFLPLCTASLNHPFELLHSSTYCFLLDMKKSIDYYNTTNYNSLAPSPTESELSRSSALLLSR